MKQNTKRLMNSTLDFTPNYNNVLEKRKVKKNGKWELIRYYNDNFEIRPKKLPQNALEHRQMNLSLLHEYVYRCNS